MPVINGEKIITEQLALKESVKVLFPNNKHTVLTPVKYIPIPEGEDVLVSLDGKWNVKQWPFTGQDESRLVKSGTSVAKWEQVVQPGKVFYADPDAEQSSIKNWNRVTLSHINDDDGAIIRRNVRIPKEWKNKQIFLAFDSIYPAGRIYVNGKKVGEHLSGLTPVQFEVSNLVLPGKDAVIAVRLMRKHKFVKMDMVRHAVEFCGLAQNAYLFVVEPCHLSDIELYANLDAKCKYGIFAGTIKIENTHKSRVKANLTILLISPDTKTTMHLRKTIIIDANKTEVVSINMPVKHPALWNDEFPNLYNVVIKLSVSKQKGQTYSFRTGFRRLDLSPSGPRLNNNFIKFRGVNHLTYHPDFGMYTPEEWLRRNLLLMKKANVNAIRTHFLGPRCLAKLCDELGIYLLQELPVDWGTDYIHNPEWVGPALMRIQGGILRDRLHPSVMVWSIGNENMPNKKEVAEDGWNHLHIYHEFVKKLDPSRPTMFPPPGPAGEKIKGILELRVGDIADIHYNFAPIRNFLQTGCIQNPNSWEGDMKEMTKEQALARGWSGVWFSSEYGIFNMIPDILNGPYLSVITENPVDPISGQNTMQVFLDRQSAEWGFMRNEPTCLGGAYFPWICSGSGKGKEGNPWGWVRWAEDADWGVMCADLTPKPFFWVLRVLFSPVWFPDKINWKNGQDIIEFEIQNQYNTIDLEQCTFRVQMGAGGWMGCLRQFKDIKLFCKPGNKVKIRIPIWKDVVESLQKGELAVCRCHLLDPKGFRSVTKDILIIPESVNMPEKIDAPVGPEGAL